MSLLLFTYIDLEWLYYIDCMKYGEPTVHSVRLANLSQIEAWGGSGAAKGMPGCLDQECWVKPVGCQLW